MNKPGNIWWGRNVGDPCRVGFTDLLLQIIDDKGNIQPPNTEGNIGIRIKPTRPIQRKSSAGLKSSLSTKKKEAEQILPKAKRKEQENKD